MKNPAIILLMLFLVFQNCSVYKVPRNPLTQVPTLEHTLGKGNVRIINNAGLEFRFNKIKLIDGVYYGLGHKKEMIRINPDHVSSIYIRDPKGLSLEQATNMGKVKVFYKKRQKTKFKNIVQRENAYYGIVSKQVETQLFPNEIDGVRLKDKVTSALLTTLAIAPAALALVTAIACNCPYVTIVDDSGGKHFQGTLFPGSILKSLERTDYLVLDHHQNSGNLNVRISNELPEKEFINEVKLLRYQIPNEERLAINESGELVAVSNFVMPSRAHDKNGIAWTKEVAAQDGVKFGFNDDPDDEQFNQLDVTFPLEAIKGTLNLTIHGKQTEWLEAVAEKLFPLVGNKLEDWNAKKDNSDPARYLEKITDKGLSLRVLASVNKEWKLIGAFHNAGTKVNRDMVISLPTDLDYGNELNIRLESAYRFWELDQVVMASTLRHNLEFEELNLKDAVSNAGTDVRVPLEKTDNRYAEILNTGEYIDLNFEIKNTTLDFHTKLVLRGTGYYHHEKRYEHNPNISALRALRKPMSMHQASKALDAYQLMTLKTQK